MTRVRVEASAAYDVVVDSGLLENVGAETAALMKPGKAVIVSGEKTGALYGDALASSLQAAGFAVLCFTHCGGEAAKSLNEYERLQSFLADMRVSRTDALFALGGGVTGDLTGFAAATYRRGIPYIQIPTTLLAAVDSSVGGKTALNLASAKNQLGCFYQPRAVFCDTDTLATLPEAEVRCGCAEVIKYGVLGDADFFAELETTDIRENYERVIAHCVCLKRDVVERDEYDRSCRRLLNLGHTVGHAIEKVSGFAVSHGDAVAIGMASILRASAKRGLCPQEDCERVIKLLKNYGLPTSCSIAPSELAEACLADKKIADGSLHLVVPEKIGQCHTVAVQPEGMEAWIEL